MRHTFTVEVCIESDDARKLVLDALLSHITDMQEQEFNSAEVLPGGEETNNTSCTVSVEYAEADGARTTAGWAAA